MTYDEHGGRTDSRIRHKFWPIQRSGRRFPHWIPVLVVCALATGAACTDQDKEQFTNTIDAIGSLFAGTDGTEITITAADSTAPTAALMLNRLADGSRDVKGLAATDRAALMIVNPGATELFTGLGTDPEGLKSIELIGTAIPHCGTTPTGPVKEMVLASFRDAGTPGAKGYPSRYTSIKISRDFMFAFAPDRRDCRPVVSVCARAKNFADQDLQSATFVVDFGNAVRPGGGLNAYVDCTGNPLGFIPDRWTPVFKPVSPSPKPSVEPSTSTPSLTFVFCLTGPLGQMELIWRGTSEEEARKDVASKHGGYTIASGKCPTPSPTST